MNYFFRTTVLAACCVITTALLSAQTLKAEIDSILSGVSGNTWSVMITSDDGQVTYYEQNKDTDLFPASNQKLYTVAAAMGILGPDYAFETKLYYDGFYNSGSGILTGNLNMLAEHDITWDDEVLNGSDQAFDFIAAQLKAQGLNQVTGNINVYGAAIYNNSTVGDIRFTPPNYQNADVAIAFRQSLIDAGISVGGSAIGRTGFNAPGILSYTHLSTDILYYNDETFHAGLAEMPLTLQVACINLMRPSHNTMADGLMFHIGYKTSGTSSLAAGAVAVTDWLEDTVGIDTTNITIGDGSGLSRLSPTSSPPGNRTTARATLNLIKYMIDHYAGYDTTLAIGGRDGTISSRYTSPSNIVGRVHAKSGSLFNTISLSGYLDHPTYGERLYFSFIANNLSGINQTATRNAIEDSLIVLADSFQPVSPTISHVVNSGDGTSMEIHLVEQASGVNNFTLTRSSDGVFFGSANVISKATPYIIETRAGGQNTGDYSESGIWADSSANTSAPGATGGIGSRWAVPVDGNGKNDSATFTPSSLSSGRYDVYVTTYGSNFLSDNAHHITITFDDANGTRTRPYDLSFETTGDAWAPIGTVDFESGQGHSITFDNSTQANVGTSANSRMVMSAVKFVPTTVSELYSGFAPGTTQYFRATATGTSLTSAVSDAYGARISPEPSKILLIDGNDRWIVQSENPTGANHTFMTLLGEAASDYAFDTADNASVLRGEVDLNDYRAVLWHFGEESTNDETFSDAEQALVNDFRNNGGRLFWSGAEVGWDLDPIGAPSDLAFFNSDLTMGYSGDDSGGETAAAVASEIFDGVGAIDFSGGAMTISFPDQLSTANGSTNVMNYNGSGSGIAALRNVQPDGSNKIIGVGFPVEMINNATTRKNVVTSAIEYLLPPDTPSLVSATPGDGEVDLVWNVSTDPRTAGYRVFRATSISGPFAEITTSKLSAATTTFTDTAVTNGVTYYYVVVAEDAYSDDSDIQTTPLSATPVASTSVKDYMIFY